ncbi:DAK2 domain-containing protein [Mycolicibacterium komossense]|uniref:DAK2 domain-containing protein n=1 Tax=Mycolicibacterium komossense TaxID=1779 RepID=A0ABT3CGP7_9MYCO|nr:DAK2 domain-containing protein [Mycolicibacterium komossense]MCV7228638.1 DAK2 domain-containing protein [Mycolicibacterium komossense]
MSDRRLDGAALREWAHTAVGDLIACTDEINRLNVFPVADADTGTNMLFTMRSALAEADSSAPAPADVAAVATALSRGALHGARGNSGVILSQILRGVADVTASAATDTRGELGDIDAPLIGAALRHAVGLVVSSMGGDVVPGTIVSVLQAAATAAEDAAADGAALATAVAAAADAAVIALDRTPQQLAVLADAGVVDAGGRGLVVLLDALSSTIAGYAPVRPVYEAQAGHAAAAPAAAPPPLQFEVMYQLAGCGAERVGALRDKLEGLGDSVAIAAACADGGHSVHVHTDDAGAAVEAGLGFGTLSRIQISALNAGASGVAPGSWARDRAVLAVVDGDGAENLFAGEGAAVLRRDADPDLAISAQQLVRALVDTGAAQVMVLPNGYVAAEELVAGCTAAIGWGIDVVPLPTGSMVQGLAALAVHEADRLAVDDGYTMAAAAGATRYGSVRVATEDALTWVGPCRRGDGLGIAGDEVLVVRHDVTAAGRGLIDLLLGVGGELVTILIGEELDGDKAEEVAALLGEHVRRHHLGTELVSYLTRHRGDALIIGVE